jgi:hypothetical protein
MRKVKLEDFGLIKQGLKRKVKNVVGDTTKLKTLLDQRGSIYTIKDLKYIVEKIYRNSNVLSSEPLSIYYSKQNNKKFKNLLDLIEIAEKDNLEEKINSEVKELHLEYQTFTSSFDKENFDKKIEEIALKYSITLTAVEDIFNRFETEWIEEIY